MSLPFLTPSPLRSPIGGGQQLTAQTELGPFHVLPEIDAHCCGCRLLMQLVPLLKQQAPIGIGQFACAQVWPLWKTPFDAEHATGVTASVQFPSAEQQAPVGHALPLHE